MDFAPNLPRLAFDADAMDQALDLHLNDIVAELRDSGIAPQPNSVFRYALRSGLSEADAANLYALLMSHTKLGGRS